MAKGWEKRSERRLKKDSRREGKDEKQGWEKDFACRETPSARGSAGGSRRQNALQGFGG